MHYAESILEVWGWGHQNEILSQYYHRTPLHCAAAYCHLDMIHYLIDNGASLFLTTQDEETPLKIAVEEYKVQSQGEGKQEGSQMAVECLHYLMGKVTG